MKRLSILIGILIFISYGVYSQVFSHEFGKYSPDEIRMEKYIKDPTADAVVIYDIGKSYFQYTDDGFQLIFERSEKVKIFTKTGMKWANIEIPYYEGKNGYEDIFELSGFTYNYENSILRKTPLDPQNNYTEKFNDNWYLKKFAMPDIKEGSVFEFKYKVKSPYLFNLRNWEFQKEIPVIYSEYITHMIPFYEYTYILQGANKFDDFKSYVDPGPENSIGSVKYHDMDYDYIMKDVPAFKDESFITSKNDYIIKLDFQLATTHDYYGATTQIMTTWPKMIKALGDHDNFGKYIKDCQKKTKEITDTMNLVQKPFNEKAETIENYVKMNFNWNGYNAEFAAKSVKEFLKTKTGNSADINLFLIGMLNSAGIEAYPVILSTRKNGKIKVNYPFDHFFNYVIAAVKTEDGFILLDATDPLSNFSEIPTQCLNDKGLLINKIKETEDNKVQWIALKSPETSTIDYQIDLKPIQGKDSIRIDCHIAADGFDALTLRKYWQSDLNDVKNALLISDLSIDSLHPVHLKEIKNPFEINFNANLSADRIEEKILISPFCNLVLTDNPLKQFYRTYPVDMVYKQEKKYTSTIHIPEGYKLLSAPKKYAVDNSDIKIQYSTEIITENTLKVTGTYEFKKDVYEVSSYIDLKGYFNKIIDRFNEKIVLEKI
jgi:hypothetical protein